LIAFLLPLRYSSYVNHTHTHLCICSVNTVIGQKAILQIFIIPNSVIGEGCCGNFRLMKGQLGNVRSEISVLHRQL